MDPEGFNLDVDGRPVAVRIRRHPRAARISLKIDAGAGALVLVLPPRASAARGAAFVRGQLEWIRTRLAALPVAVPFAPGAQVPLLGVTHEVVHAPQARRGVWAEDGRLHVSGLAEHLPRRLGDWLKARARAEVTPRAVALAARVARPVGRITLRDTRSRWGSCSAAGDLAFSWRLVLAPMSVLDYVVAHEVAHLVELNHSPAFWRVVAELVPDPRGPRAWLKRHGALLHRYG